VTEDDKGYVLAEKVGDIINDGDYTVDEVAQALTFIIGSCVSEPPHDTKTYGMRLQEILRSIDASRRAHLKEQGVEAQHAFADLVRTH
jgi:hypothetical protein